MCEICSKLKIKAPEQRPWCCSGVFIVNLEQIFTRSLFFFVDLEQEHGSWND